MRWKDQKVPKFHARGALEDCLLKNYHQNNFSTSEPISTNNKPIDSARQAETHRNEKKIFKTHFSVATGQFS
jgi:hypothetical protein